MEKTVRTIVDYLNIIDAIDKAYPSDRFKSALIFRGLSNFEHKLLPGFYRTCRRRTARGEETLPLLGDATENEVLHHFIKNAMSVVGHIDRDDLLTWLTYAQHFGAPTRLLDFSSNPLVSLFFSCKREFETDGGVCVLHEKNYVRSLNLGAVPTRKKADVLAEILGNVQDPACDCTRYPVTFIPHYIDNRMEAQESRFVIWGRDKAPFETIAEPHGSMLEGDESAFFCKIRIDGARKRDLLRELSFLGVNEKKIFPGLDGMGRYIAEYYRVVPTVQ